MARVLQSQNVEIKPDLKLHTGSGRSPVKGLPHKHLDQKEISSLVQRWEKNGLCPHPYCHRKTRKLNNAAAIREHWFIYHMAVGHDLRFKCECRRLFIYARDYRRHLLLDHSVTKMEAGNRINKIKDKWRLKNLRIDVRSESKCYVELCRVMVKQDALCSTSASDGEFKLDASVESKTKKPVVLSDAKDSSEEPKSKRQKTDQVSSLPVFEEVKLDEVPVSDTITEKDPKPSTSSNKSRTLGVITSLNNPAKSSSPLLPVPLLSTCPPDPTSATTSAVESLPAPKTMSPAAEAELRGKIETLTKELLEARNLTSELVRENSRLREENEKHVNDEKKKKTRVCHLELSEDKVELLTALLKEIADKSWPLGKDIKNMSAQDENM